MPDNDNFLKTKIILVISANMILFGLIAMAKQDDVGVHIPLLMILGPWIVIMNLIIFVYFPLKMMVSVAFGFDRKRAAVDRSYQYQARAFLKLEIPEELNELGYSFVNDCIEEFAANGEIDLSEHERTTISLELTYAEVTNQKLSESTQHYLHERDEVLRNILLASTA